MKRLFFRQGIVMSLVVILLIGILTTGCGSQDTQDGDVNGGNISEISFPEGPVTLIAWGSPGGGSDVFARTLAKASEPILGKPVVVENKPGGGGATAMAYLKSQKSDGYTILAVTTNLVLTPLTKNTPNTYEDFDSVIMVGRDATMTAVKADGEITNVDDLIALGKDRSIKWGTFGVGTTDHIAAAMLAENTGINIDFVPFEGGGEAIAALLGGHIDVINANPSEIADQIKAEQLAGIGVFSTERLKDFGDVPTYKEKGYDIVVETWRGIIAPKGTPDEVKNILFEAFKGALEDEAMKDYYQKNNIIKDVKNGDDFYKFIEQENNFYKKILTDMGLLN